VRSEFPWQTAIILFAGALVVRVVAIVATGFDGLYGQDAYAYFDQAMALILLSMWTALEFANTPHRRWLLALIVIFGCAAVATRWASILVAPALAAPSLRGLTQGRRLRRLFPVLIAAGLGSGMILFTLFQIKAFEHHSDLETAEIFDQDAVTLGMLINSGRPLFLLAQPDDIKTRWQDQAPGINTRWLEHRGSLREVEAWEPYALRQFEENDSHRPGLLKAEPTS